MSATHIRDHGVTAVRSHEVLHLARRSRAQMAAADEMRCYVVSCCVGAGAAVGTVLHRVAHGGRIPWGIWRLKWQGRRDTSMVRYGEGGSDVSRRRVLTALLKRNERLGEQMALFGFVALLLRENY